MRCERPHRPTRELRTVLCADARNTSGSAICATWGRHRQPELTLQRDAVAGEACRGRQRICGWNARPQFLSGLKGMIQWATTLVLRRDSRLCFGDTQTWPKGMPIRLWETMLAMNRTSVMTKTLPHHWGSSSQNAGLYTWTRRAKKHWSSSERDWTCLKIMRMMISTNERDRSSEREMTMSKRGREVLSGNELAFPR